MIVSELVNKSEVLDIWNNYWITDMTNLDAENQLRELATVELKSAPQLNENQQIVLEWLKGNLVLGYGASLIRTIYLLQRENTIEIPENRYIREAYRSLSTSEEATVVQMFIDWALEQGEE